MASYKEIQVYVQKKSGFVPKTCWIAHVKDICGLSPNIAPNRNNANERKYPCPDNKIDVLKDAFRHFKMI